MIAALVTVSFALSFAFSVLPYLKLLSEGIRIIILTVSISAFAAIVCPRNIDDEEDCADE